MLDPQDVQQYFLSLTWPQLPACQQPNKRNVSFCSLKDNLSALEEGEVGKQAGAG